MKTLVDISYLNIDKNTPRGTAAAKVFKDVDRVFCEVTEDCDIYLHDPDPDYEEICVFGFDEPEHIITTALQWNDNIRNNFSLALERLEKERIANGGRYRMDNTTTYEMQKAARDLDNSFHPYTNQAFLRDKRYCFDTVLTTIDVEDIKEHPENYAIIEVWAK